MTNRQLARLLAVFGIWVVTEWAVLITVSVIALERGGAGAVGVAGAVRVLPAALTAGALSGLADRLPRPQLVAAVNAGWVLVVLALAWLTWVDAPFVALMVVLAVGSAVSSVLKPCLQALLPQLVEEPSQLVIANSAFATTEGLGVILGPLLCALLLTTAGAAWAFVVLGVLYAISAALAAQIRTPYAPVRAAASARGSARADSPGGGALAGVRLLLAPGTRTAFSLIMAQTAMRGLLNVFVILVAAGQVSGAVGAAPAATSSAGEGRAGSLFAAVGVGGVVGATTLLGATGGRRTVTWFALGVAAWGVGVAVVGLWPGVVVAWIALAFIGFGNAVEDVYGYSILSRLTPDHLAGRMWGAFNATGAAMLALGSLVAPPLVTLLGLSPAMILTGALLAAAPAVAIPGLRRLTSVTDRGRDQINLLRTVAVFAPLSLVALERLARAASTRECVSGEVVTREGDLPGPRDAFFVVVHGELAVTQGGVAVRRLGPGETFGEIALLRSVPRTATVVADTPTRLLTLDAAAFVPAVTGHRPTHDLASSSVEERLTEDAVRRVSDRRAGHPGSDGREGPDVEGDT